MNHCHLALGTILLISVMSSASAIDTGPPDTSSPRGTFDSFLSLTHELAGRYTAYLADPNQETQHALVRTIDRGQFLMNLSEIAPTARREVAADAVVKIWSLVARVELPRSEDIPDAAAFGNDGPLAHQPPKWRLPGTGIVIQRVDEGQQTGEFLFSAQTIASLDRYIEAAHELPYLRQEPVADLSGTLDRFSGWMLPPRLVARIPGWAQHPIAGQVVWKWLLIFASLALYGLLVIMVWRWAKHRKWDSRAITLLRKLTTPLVVLVFMRLVRVFLNEQVQTTGVAVALPDYLAELATGVALVWMVWWLAVWIPNIFIGSPRVSARSLNAGMVRLIVRAIAVLATVFFVFYVAYDLGIPLYGLLAGAGVGGLAIALAARPTLENFIGALNLFVDRPIRVGDLCRFDERHGQGWNPVGTVEEIGLRSTKIRQFDRSLITIPNADLADRNIVNLSTCETFLLHQRFAVRYETTDDQLRYLLTKLRELLHGHPRTIHTAADPIRVRFLGFRDHELSVEMRTYIRTTIYQEFLAIQEDIMLRAMKIVKQAGTGFALPSQTLYMARYDGLDDAGREAAEKRVREWGSAQELPFPDLAEEHRKRVSGKLDYPPEGSPGADRG